MAKSVFARVPSSANIHTGSGVLRGFLISHSKGATDTVTFYDNTAADDQIEVTYLALHTTTFSGDSSYVTVPEEHVPILVAYCVWKGTRELLLTEQQNPDTTIHLIYDMTRQAQAAWDAYNDLIKPALASAGRSAVTTGCAMDDYDPIC